MRESPKSEFANKLSRYSVVSVGGLAGTMACFESSEASMVHTTTLITLANNAAAAPTTELNLNGANGPASLLDGVADVRVTVLTASLASAQGLNGGLLGGAVGGGGFFYPTAFQVASTIGPAIGFGGGSTIPAASNSFGTLANGSLDGNWAGSTPTAGYVGIKFQIGGNDHFGWVHVNWDPSAATATIDRYAYNSEAGEAALVPEPSSLALLGIGALGLAARRRRKDAR